MEQRQRKAVARNSGFIAVSYTTVLFNKLVSKSFIAFYPCILAVALSTSDSAELIEYTVSSIKRWEDKTSSYALKLQRRVLCLG